MVTTSRPQLHRVTCSNKTPIPAAPADRRHGRYLHVPGTNKIWKKKLLMGKKKGTTSGNFLLSHWLPRILWKGAHGLPKSAPFLSQQGKMPEIPAASSVSCHDGRKDSSTCHLKFSWNLLNFSVFRTERAVFTSKYEQFWENWEITATTTIHKCSCTPWTCCSIKVNACFTSVTWDRAKSKLKNRKFKNLASEDSWSFKSQRCPVSCWNCWQCDSTIPTVDSQVTVSMILILK